MAGKQVGRASQGAAPTCAADWSCMRRWGKYADRRRVSVADRRQALLGFSQIMKQKPIQARGVTRIRDGGKGLGQGALGYKGHFQGFMQLHSTGRQTDADADCHNTPHLHICMTQLLENVTTDV